MMLILSKRTSNLHNLIFFCVCLILSSELAAEEQPVPDQIDAVVKVSAEGVIELVEKFDELIIVDSRIKGDRQRGYLESSISLPDKETNCKSLAKVIPTLKSPSLFYCNGVKCGRSVVAINVAKKCGYKKIYWFRGGFEMWLKKGFPFIKQ